MKRSYESPEVLNARNREHRQRMRDKGFKYISLWVPAVLEGEVKELVNKLNSQINNLN